MLWLNAVVFFCVASWWNILLEQSFNVFLSNCGYSVFLNRYLLTYLEFLKSVWGEILSLWSSCWPGYVKLNFLAQEQQNRLDTRQEAAIGDNSLAAGRRSLIPRRTRSGGRHSSLLSRSLVRWCSGDQWEVWKIKISVISGLFVGAIFWVDWSFFCEQNDDERVDAAWLSFW